MCGIAGMLNITEGDLEIRSMTRMMSSRGPDDYGIFVDSLSKIQLGQTRLSIIDLSMNGHQPMDYLNGKYTIVFNGEIYNYRSIRIFLENNGYVFNTQSDTEVILAAYDYWGSECCTQFNGMFAFAIWDSSKQEMFIARDRFGIKPLLYCIHSEGLLFASEIKAILASNLIPRLINKKAVFDLFTYGSVCQPNTIIENVKSLLPGHFLKIYKNNEIEITRYYNLKENVDLVKKKINGLDYSELVDVVRNKLVESVKLNLVSDVKVGSFLSSGIDSMAISALMSKNSSSQLCSFTIGYAKTGNLKSELENSKQVSNYFNFNHKEILLTQNDLKNSFESIIYAMDQPTYDGINVYFVSKFASEKVKVAISGLGGDELFAGYSHFHLLLNASKQKNRVWNKFLVFIGKIRPNKYSSEAKYRSNSIINNLSGLRNILDSQKIQKSFNKHFLKEYNPFSMISYLNEFLYSDCNIIENISYSEINNYLVNTLLRDTDVMSMANGLEVRPVFLNHELVELALALPLHTKIDNGKQKIILRDAMKDLIPLEFLHFKKQGFEVPIYDWMYSCFKNDLLDVVNSKEIYEMFDAKFISALKKDISLERNNKLVWLIFVFHNWMIMNKCKF